MKSKIASATAVDDTSIYTPRRRVPQNCVTKTDIFGVLTAYFFFLNPLQIFLTRVEIILFINHYFLVYILDFSSSSYSYSFGPASVTL